MWSAVGVEHSEPSAGVQPDLEAAAVELCRPPLTEIPRAATPQQPAGDECSVAAR